ncbi:cobalamin B12-binding domain-containing protein [Desulfovibrio gilichinskyi]|uniref:Methanogenic corrinoid protein MtbC1 n=1 Tax=Desulfovibrio gilichinskyi TaxID=1519643 RepID=A0A1X7CEK8_9BACT|nr:cobalamin-dependent protein [Desulfovibrio gilichinskyi]SME95096.1 Methanogenic corrinoid protein MtbC1 [Desulfovibrio gilichinskyi]
MIQNQLIKSLQQLPNLNRLAAKSLNGKCEYLAHNLISSISNSHIAKPLQQQSSVMLEINCVRHFQYIKSFIELFDPFSFVEIFKWMFRIDSNHGFPYEYWKVMLPLSLTLLKKEIPTCDFKQIEPLYDWLMSYYDKMVELSLAEKSFFEQVEENIGPAQDGETKNKKLKQFSDVYVDLLLHGKRAEAIELIMKAVSAGIQLEDVYLKILQPAMYKIGKKWQMNEVNVAVEHYCTAATQMLLAMLFPLGLDSGKHRKKMVGCCLGSELHELGMRMVSDFFEFAGWNTYFLGAITPSESLIETIKKEQPEIVCLSSSMYFGVPECKEVISMIKMIDSYPPPKVLVGGLAFNLNPSLSIVVGADGFSKNAREAIVTAEHLC